MATTVLECDEFATVLLDTEGIDAVRASKTMAMSLLTLTTLLSSFLIYNSRRVPQKVDLDGMRCFTQLSTSLLAQCGESCEMKKSFFPHFLWLLRDVGLKMTDRRGKEVGPTEFLHKRILTAESGELTDLGKSLVSLFPSLECATLPIPSTKRNVVCKILEQEDNLNPVFNAAVDALIQHILQQITPKTAVNGTVAVNGKGVAALAGGYVEAVNSPGAVPDLDQGWQAVVRLELKECSDKLVREYEREMAEALEGNLPMEERNLFRIHQQTLKRKKRELREEIHYINPLHTTEEEIQPLLNELEEAIVQWTEPSSNGWRKVTGGTLYPFTTQNIDFSKKHCGRLFRDLLEKSKVEENFIRAMKDSLPLTIEREISEITAEYNRKAVGPAAREVLEKELSQLNQISKSLKDIPGAPQNVKVLGIGSDKVKLCWDPPQHNPEAVEEYVVYKNEGDGVWKEAARTNKTKVLVKQLESNTKHEFRVIAINSTVISLPFEAGTATKLSAGKGAAFFASAVFPSLVGLMVAGKIPLPVPRKKPVLSSSATATLVGVSIAGVGLSLLLSPVLITVVPVVAVVGAVGAIGSKWGDLSEE